MVTEVPPFTDPLFGATPETAGAGAVEMFSENPVDVDADCESLTCVVKEKDPASVGVPDTAPVDELRVKPLGRCPLVVLHV